MSIHSNSASVNSRYQAIRDSISREIRKINIPRDNLDRPMLISEYFAMNTFGVPEIRSALHDSDFAEFERTINEGQRLEKPLADKIAKAVRAWATEKGISHFCHWFQPMTGHTAEKHDSFLAFEDGKPMEKFSGSQLIQQEPDASSFPSGGMRATFEARGYTVWDPSSPMFIMESTNGRTLCIPSAFISYTGHALDEKTPLLRSNEALNRAAMKLLRTLGDTKASRVKATLGAEQEYFLIDRAFSALRPDLLLTGRTLIGAQSPKSHELDDHYFGSIPSRVTAFMQEVEYELYRIGVPAKTRHNEVAPGQFELAPIFEDANIAVDHNHLIMDILGKVARRHNLSLLLHEKPFAQINGNGKHNNWSMSTDRDENLLEPGDTPHKNLRFLVMLACVLKAVNKHSGLLRASIANPGNDHRLGGNEAPPAIISVFLGEELTNILNKIEEGQEITDTDKGMIDLKVSSVPLAKKDTTDRNRTSPFAFTGNKFEFRAVGGSSSCSFPITCLNTSVAEAMEEVNAMFEKAGFAESSEKQKVTIDVIRSIYKETKRIRFEGNNYGADWVKEAESRGLPHLKNTPQALSALKEEQTKSLFRDLRILDDAEQESRWNIAYENYNRKIEIETDTMLKLLDMYVFPAATSYLADMCTALEKIKNVGANHTPQESFVKVFGDMVADLDKKYIAFREELKAAKSIEDEHKRAFAFAEKVMPKMAETREACDLVEDKMGDAYWPLPKYREMLFLK